MRLRFFLTQVLQTDWDKRSPLSLIFPITDFSSRAVHWFTCRGWNHSKNRWSGWRRRWVSPPSRRRGNPLPAEAEYVLSFMPTCQLIMSRWSCFVAPACILSIWVLRYVETSICAPVKIISLSLTLCPGNSGLPAHFPLALGTDCSTWYPWSHVNACPILSSGHSLSFRLHMGHRMS